MRLLHGQRSDRMIAGYWAPEENNRSLLAFRKRLEREVEGDSLDQRVADVCLYALEFASERLNGSKVSETSAFDVHCFLADYVISHVPDCSPEAIKRIADSLCAFMEFLTELGRISLIDLEEIFALCDDPEPYIARLQEYKKLLAAQDLIGLQRWRAQVLDPFESDS